MSQYRRFASVGVVVFICSCGDATRQPSAPTPLSGPNSLSGFVVANQERSPVSTATVSLYGPAGASTLTTDQGGAFMFQALPTATLELSLSALGYVPRRSRIELTASRSDITFDMIREAAPFSLPFYRQFARNGNESAVLAPILPWTLAPSFYVRTVTDDSNESVSVSILEAVKRIVFNSVPELSGGRFTAAGVETGRDERPQQPGWVNISFVRNSSLIGGAAGSATVGGNSGTIRLLYDPARCAACTPECGSLTEWSIDHEIVHVMGFYHTAMDGSEFHSGSGCQGSGRPAITRYHAAVMYSRPRGNIDPDTDASVFYLLAAENKSQPVVTCPLPSGLR